LLADYFIRFKNPVFHDEQEWRLVVLGNVGEEVHYRESRFGLVPYVKAGEYIKAGDHIRHQEHTQARKRPLPIKTVVQGPRVEPELSKEAVDGFLAKHGYAREIVKVLLRKIPLLY
jgi:hypothetical protein